MRTARAWSGRECPAVRPNHSCSPATTGSRTTATGTRVAEIRETVESEQHGGSALVTDIESGRLKSPLGDDERFTVILGITCHAVYHAGQIQLIKRLHAK